MYVFMPCRARQERKGVENELPFLARTLQVSGHLIVSPIDAVVIIFAG